YGHQASATDREEHGRRELIGASDRSEMGRRPAAAPAGEDVPAAWHRHLAQDHGRLVGAVRGPARSFVPVDEEVVLNSKVIGTDDTSVKVLDRRNFLKDTRGICRQTP